MQGSKQRGVQHIVYRAIGFLQARISLEALELFDVLGQEIQARLDMHPEFACGNSSGIPLNVPYDLA